MKTHGMSGTPTYRVWAAMIQRCSNPGQQNYARYGGRGITVCAEWRASGGFERFFAAMGHRPDGHTIDRIDNDRGYEPGNCRWATPAEQNLNRRALTTRALKTHCKRGHALVDDNLTGAPGDRECRTCQRERNRMWQRNRRANLKAQT